MTQASLMGCRTRTRIPYQSPSVDDGAMSERLRPLGLIGGMSWHSTATYYRRVNERVAQARGAHASARISLQSLDFSEVRACQVADDYARSGRMLAEAGLACEAGGAEVLAICTNLMHRNYDDLVAAVRTPVLHIADAVAAACLREGRTRVGLLVPPGASPLPVLDTALVHADALADLALDPTLPLPLPLPLPRVPA
ncbi:MAG: aspartate/glutamate racemase family protein [Actinobacteria bacterium]|nr:aspartate/glutamate racemase family protein [Actinomycetota bacterium]